MNLRTVFIAACASLLIFTQSVSAESLYVKVRATKLRAAPQQWANAIADVRYGDVLQSASKDRGWHRVTLRNLSGYVHESALTERKVVLTASDAVGDGASRDIILAGKGFNKEVERNYARTNRALNYTAVDAMERLVVSDAELASFVRAGNLGAEN